MRERSSDPTLFEAQVVQYARARLSSSQPCPVDYHPSVYVPSCAKTDFPSSWGVTFDTSFPEDAHNRLGLFNETQKVTQSIASTTSSLRPGGSRSPA
jgi:hypothetical protein